MEIKKRNLNYVFRVQIDGLEDLLIRDIIIDSNDTLASLAYITLASVNAMSHHMFKMNVKFNYEVSFSCVLLKDFKEEMIQEYLAKEYQLWKFRLEEGDMIELDYGFGVKWHFNIQLIERKVEDSKYSVPGVISGKGYGIEENNSLDHLKDLYIGKIQSKGINYNDFEIDDEKYRDYYIYLREIYENVQDR